MTRSVDTAVLVRSHIANLKTAHLLHDLQGGRNYDLYVAANETDGPRSFPPFETLGHTLGDFERLGFDMVDPRSILTYSDVLFSIIRERIPQYRHYLLLEFDVHFLRPAFLWMEAFVDRLHAGEEAPPDLVATDIRPVGPDWPWYASCHRSYPNVHAAFFPFVCLSDRAISHLLDGRRRAAAERTGDQEPIFCEAFVPSALLADPTFRVTDLKTLLPGAYDQGSFNVTMPEPLREGRFRSQPVAMVHPVKDLSEAVASPELRERVAGLEAKQRGLPQPLASQIAMRAGAIVRRCMEGRTAALDDLEALDASL